MFKKAFRRASHAVEGVAIEAALGLAALLLALSAFLFIAAGLAILLAQTLPLWGALMAAGAAIFVIAGLFFLAARIDFSDDHARDQVEAPLSEGFDLGQALTHLSRPTGMLASTMLTRHLKNAPLSTITAATAVGVFLALLTGGDDDTDR